MDVLLENEPLPGIVQWVLNRPSARNALDSELIARLHDAVRRHSEREETRVVVIRAAGAAFCAGVDLTAMKAQGMATAADNAADALQLASLLSALNAMPKPTVAAVQGPAFGAGIGLVAACDVAIGSEEAKFCLPEVRLGIVPAVISPYVIDAVGLRHARRYALTGEMISAARAVEIGLLHDIYPLAGLGGEALRIATELTQGGPKALAACKTLLAGTARTAAGPQRDVALSAVLAERRASDEGQTGLESHLARRVPPWAP